MNLLFGMPSVFPCSISALSSANDRAGASSLAACSPPCSAGRLVLATRAEVSILNASSKVSEFPVALRGFNV